MVGQGLDLNTSQHQTLTLTPQLLQAIRMLEMPLAELNTYIEEELENNPTLEAVWDKPEPTGERQAIKSKLDDFDWAEYLKEKGSDYASYSYGLNSEENFNRPLSEAKLRDSLMEQLTKKMLLRISSDTTRAYEIVSWIAETLDGNGFLTLSAPEIARITKISENEAQAAIDVLKGLEPAGIAATGICESLILQYERNGGSDPFVIEIIQTRLADVAKQNTGAVARAFGKHRSEVRSAFDIISALNPKPCMGFASRNETFYIIPDFIIDKTAGQYKALFNKTYLPTLSVSPYYYKILSETAKGSDEYVFITEKLNSAITVIKNIERREQTICKIMDSIISRQQDFLEKGEAFLKPLTLKQIAEEIGVHESTVSRAIRGKYVQLPRKVVEIKQFFCTGLKTNNGESASAESIKSRIAALICSEDKHAPLSDRAIADILKDEALVSRRTVAKYRCEIGVLSSSKRAIK